MIHSLPRQPYSANFYGHRYVSTKRSQGSLCQSYTYIGADVGHPGPGVMHQPSVTGLVASVDDNITTFTSYSHVQQIRLEIIQDLEEMMVCILTHILSYM